jgi:type IV secretion system protein VirB11
VGVPDGRSSLDHFCLPLAQLLSDVSVTELCIQSPGEVLIERASGWTKTPAPWASMPWAVHFARLLAASSAQRVSPESPLLSAALPTGERVQVVLPPATAQGRVAIAIRRPSRGPWSLDDLQRSGLFNGCVPVSSHAPSTHCALHDAYAAGNWRAFLSAAVLARLNIVVAGATGAGKTTLTKALIDEIPEDTRLISIEDTPELHFHRHRNVVNLYYSKDNQGRARVTPKQLLEASLRLRPDRILLSEVRGEEAYYYLRNVGSGHPGSITSVHAGSSALAFEQLALLVKESGPGRDMPLADIHRMLHAVIDVVVHCDRVGGGRRVTELWWRGAGRS